MFSKCCECAFCLNDSVPWEKNFLCLHPAIGGNGKEILFGMLELENKVKPDWCPLRNLE